MREGIDKLTFRDQRSLTHEFVEFGVRVKTLNLSELPSDHVSINSAACRPTPQFVFETSQSPAPIPD
jgi:hypothetical protein